MFSNVYFSNLGITLFPQTFSIYRLKFFEVFFEAYPQLLISLMLMMRLNIYDWLYVGRLGRHFNSGHLLYFLK